jgi:hypothetical protein
MTKNIPEKKDIMPLNRSRREKNRMVRENPDSVEQRE